MADPVHSHADHRATDDRQIERRIPVAHAAAVFTGDDVQALVQSVFDAPVVAIGSEHLLGVHLPGRARGEQKLYFGLFDRLARKVNPAGEPGGLLGKGKVDAGGADLKGAQTTFFGPPAVDL